MQAKHKIMLFTFVAVLIALAMVNNVSAFNPLNIRISNNVWMSKVTPSQDKAFDTFSNHKYGFRAAANLVRNYQVLALL
ncbi:hypothetical protein [Vibrio sp. 10N.261.51.F12]|uniref:hypothetical protein n=1 Tax=Vibrio sp. 10N.261.51.F12 TaxID=3229679 RepID=UPI0035588DB5